MIGIFDAIIGLFLWAAGLCVGSFLNVVVYRLPRGMSVGEPRWSFCPACDAQLLTRDNLPLISWVVLRGRCRSCRAPISSQYPLVEALTGMVFVLTYFLLFINKTRAGLPTPLFPTDTLVLLAWLVLAGALVACSVMDFVSYTLDTRVTDVALYVGLLAMALWPRPEFARQVAGASDSPLLAACLVAMIASGLMLRFFPGRQEESLSPADVVDSPPALQPDTPATESAPQPSGAWIGVLGMIFFTLCAVILLTTIAIRPWSPGLTPQNPTEHVANVLMTWAAPAALLGLFFAMVAANGAHRAADADIHAAIEAEAPAARGVALRELAWLTPILLVASAAYFAVDRWPDAHAAWFAATAWQPFEGLRSLGGYARLTPLATLAFAAHGAMLAAALGWALRIVFTLAFGREAYGVGDIFLMAAAGATAGWDIAFLGFLLACALAAASWLFGLLSKRAAMMPFVPPLSLGFLAALWLSAPATRVAWEYWSDLTLMVEERPLLAQIALGVLLLVGTLAVLVAKSLRQALEGADPIAGAGPAAPSADTVTPATLLPPPAASQDQGSPPQSNDLPPVAPDSLDAR